MALDHVEFTDRLGRPLPQKLHEQLVQCVISAIAHPKADVEAVLKRARVIARRAAKGQIKDVGHYATKALFAVSREASVKREREPLTSHPPRIIEILAGAAKEASPAALEDRILCGNPNVLQARQVRAITAATNHRMPVGLLNGEATNCRSGKRVDL
jgi:hypothetical protein